jgi:hypothetical protein
MTAVRELYRACGLPVFQNRMYATNAEARTSPVGDVRLVEDLTTGLVYNAAFRPDLLDYDEHYQNEQAVSANFRRHLEEVADIVTRTLGKRSIIEVGCGKGYFLEMLEERGFDITGFDPAHEGSNPAIEKRYFDAYAGIQGDALVLRHILEHVADPVAFLAQLRDANGGRGRIYIEVPCFDWICERGAWFDIFYEHVNYFRPVDFERMFGSVHESGHLFGGQYQYVAAELGSLRAPSYDARSAVDFPAMLSPVVARPAPGDAGVVIWGGASKGVIFALNCLRNGTPVSSVIDINPAKQGKYLPATGLLVQAPHDVLPGLPAGSVIYVMNSNYLDEIRATAGSQFTYIGIDT